MSLDKTKKRLEKVRESNRALRNFGLVALSEPGPWFSVPTAYRFDPSFFRNLISAEPPADSTVIGDSVPRLS
jgi:hypothetical protein